MKILTVAVAGNPNSGKSTLINAIAGTSLQVGNWPGVTVEKKIATIKLNDLTINFVDLPGTYSLSPYTQEETIARNFLIKDKPNLIINVVDSTNLERNLYLTVQLLELGLPVVVALNIFDEAKKKGYDFNLKKFEELLSIKVIPTIAIKKEGIKELIDYIKKFAYDNSNFIYKQLDYGEAIEESIKVVKDVLKIIKPLLLNQYPIRWLSLKLLEEDQILLEETGINRDEPFLQKIRGQLVKSSHEDIESLLTDIRYGIASRVTRDTLLKKRGPKKADLTEKIDKIVLNRFLGLPIFLIAIWLIFKVAFDFSMPFKDWIDSVVGGPLTKWTKFSLEQIGGSEWLISLITDGIIAGVGAVLVFTPVIGVMMLLITFLEGSGYMARAAFVMDRLMHSVGLHGKSFIPMLLGFGCNVPSIYATRVLETERDRKLTTMLVPFMSCSAKLPVYVVFIGSFFSQNPVAVLWSLYVMGIVIALLLGLILKRTLFKGFTPVFIMELPPYRLPLFRDLMLHTWQKLKHFLIKAGTYILAASIIMWFLLNAPYGVEKKNSALGRIGNAISPIFEPLGFGTWEASSSLLAGLIAKELVVSTMAQIYVEEDKATDKEGSATEEQAQEKDTSLMEDIKDSAISFVIAIKDAFSNLILNVGIQSLSVEKDEKNQEQNLLQSKLQAIFSPLTAYTFLIFVLLYWPCVVAGIAMRQEFGSWKLYAQALIIHSITAWIVAFGVYQGGKLLRF